MRVLPFILGGLLIAAGAGPALADVYTYTYTGQDYQYARGAYTTSERVTGSVTLASPLPANLSFISGNLIYPVAVSVLSFSFSDGLQTITDASPGLYTTIFEFATDAAGAPDEWQIVLEQSAVSGSTVYYNGITAGYLTAGFTEDLGSYDALGGGGGPNEAYNQDDPGTWTLPVSQTPEPGSLMLAATGAVGVMLAGVRRRQC